MHAKSTKWFYHKCPETDHDGVSHPINPQGHVNVFTAACALPAQSAVRGGPAMTQRPAKRLPTWLTIDLAVILVSLVIIGLWMWLARW